MRTKTLLIAAAALAAGVMTSQAQVYSQNVVGYVNQIVTGGGALTLCQNPLVGTTNGAEETLNGLSNGDTLYLWSGAGFYVYQYQQGAVTGAGAPTDWTDGGGVPIPGGVYNASFGYTFVPDPQLATGSGYIIQNSQATFETNTYVGSVILNSTNVLSGGGALSLVGSKLPIAGDLETNGIVNLPLYGGETLYVWGTGGYYIYQYQAGAVSQDGAPTDWTDGGGVPIPGGVYNNTFGYTFVANPQITVGQSFLYQSATTTNINWVQNLVLQ
jgi:hypothetical protein